MDDLFDRLTKRISKTFQITETQEEKSNEEVESTSTDTQSEDPDTEEETPMNDLMEASYTTPSYTSPVLFEDSHLKDKIRHALSSANIQSVDFDLYNFGTNEPHISLHVESELSEPADRRVTLRLEIRNFTDWAAESRLDELENGEIHELLGMNGPYYVDIGNELEELIEDMDMITLRKESYDSEEDFAVFSDTLRFNAYDKTALFSDDN